MSQIAGEVQPGFLRMPKLPVTGLFARLLAFLLDIFLIISALHLISRHMPDVLWAMGEWSNYLGGILTFGYLVFFNGPFGKGRTIGKMILGIQVTDYDGNPPTYRQAIIRTVVLIPVLVLSPVVELFGPSTSAMQDYVKTLFTLFPFWAIILGTVLTLAFNPFKQGLHDYFAETLVRPIGGKGEPVPSFEDLAQQVGHSWPKFHRQPIYSGGISVLMFMSLFAFLAHPSMQPESRRAAQDARYALARIPGLERALIPMEPFDAREYRENVLQEEAALPEQEPVEEEAPLLTLEELGLADDTSEEPGETEEAEHTEPPALEDENVYLIIPVLMGATWRGDPESARFQAMAGELLEQYYGNVMPHLLSLYRDDPQERLQQRYEAWTTKPIELQAVFWSQIDLRPYQVPLRRIWGEYSRTFPPMETPN